MAIWRGAGGPGDATTDAANEATVASNKATEAAASAAAAAASASTASTAATSAGTSATNSANSATAAASSASAAASSASAAAGSATSAGAALSDAVIAQAAAEAAQVAAETAETNAETAQTAAEVAQTGAETAQTAAETAQAASEAASASALAGLANFDDRYFGAHATDAAVATYATAEGFTIDAGDIYFDTTLVIMKVYTGSSWSAAYVDGNFGLNELTDVVITSATTGQVIKYNGTNWVNSSDYATSAQGALADSATQPGDNVSDLTNDAGYLTSFTETDPVFSAAPAAGITSTQVTNWDTAYGWGNHASAGYLTLETYTGTVTSVDMTVPTGLSVTGNPVTSSGTLAISYATGYSIPTTASQSSWNDAYSFAVSFPTQTGNSGKYLTTDGSNLSWGIVDADPAGTAVALAIALG